MTAPEPKPDSAHAGFNRLRRWIPILVAVTAILSLGLAFSLAYFRAARLEDGILYQACACGFKRAKVANGEVVLVEPNHDRPAGTSIATIEIGDGICILRRIGEDGTLVTAESYEIDHLGAKYYDETFGTFIYVIMTDNWKLYLATLPARVKAMFE